MALASHARPLLRLTRKAPVQVQISKRHLSGRNSKDPKFYHNLIYNFFSEPKQTKHNFRPRTEQERKVDDLFKRNIWNRDYYGKSMYSSFLWDGKPISNNWTTRFIQSQIPKLQARDLKAFDALWQDLNNMFGLRTGLQDHNRATSQTRQAQEQQAQQSTSTQSQHDGEIDFITMRRKQTAMDLKDNQDPSEKVEIDQNQNDTAKQEDSQDHPDSFEEWRKLPEQKRPKTTDRDHVTQFSPVVEELNCFTSGRVENEPFNVTATSQTSRKRASNSHHDETDNWGGLESLDRPAVEPPGSNPPQEKKPSTKPPPETEQHWVWDDANHEATKHKHPSEPKGTPKKHATASSTLYEPTASQVLANERKVIKDELNNRRNSEGLLDPHDPFEREHEVDEISRNTPKTDPQSQRNGEETWRKIFERETDSEGLDPAHKQQPRSNLDRKAQSIETTETVKAKEETIRTNVLPDTPLTSPQIILALQTTPEGAQLVSIPYIPSTAPNSTAAESKNLLSLLHILDNKPLFFSQFERLQREGYALVDGGVDFLVFQRTEKETRGEEAKKNGWTGGMGWNTMKTGAAMAVGAGSLYGFGKLSKAIGWTSGASETAAIGERTAVGKGISA
ncbi:hypothetical protein BJ508DRAFT_411055 [Ascobolus immersus RN42]|uniref:Uncharacterized protein n=1 Tax=Ascobolus immersus RN42 TaxID=1160509 RepID=A0A3N4ILZ4_ASCIM|nr:hypothetical protein BJ508DRAFT_411055 [Ascobolus immersus RN42]